MSLYINHENHKAIYKNESKIKAPNQALFIRNRVGEMIKEQQQINQNLQHSFHSLKKRYEQQESKWIAINNELQKLNAGQLSANEVINQLNELTAFYQSIAGQIKNNESVSNDLLLKMEEQLELQKQMKTELHKQEENQREVFVRLDNQEALMEKVTRQIDYFRSILFERTNHITEKMEEGFQLTSAYVHHLLLNKDKLPISFLLFQKREKEEEEEQVGTPK